MGSAGLGARVVSHIGLAWSEAALQVARHIGLAWGEAALQAALIDTHHDIGHRRVGAALVVVVADTEVHIWWMRPVDIRQVVQMPGSRFEAQEQHENRTVLRLVAAQRAVQMDNQLLRAHRKASWYQWSSPVEGGSRMVC